MEKVINGVCYNTKDAELLYEEESRADNNTSYGKRAYRTDDGKFFFETFRIDRHESEFDIELPSGEELTNLENKYNVE